MRVITTFDPTAASSGSFNSGIVNPGSKMIIMNESSVNLQFTFANGFQAQIPANWARLFRMEQPNYTVFWKQQSSGGTSSVQPTNQVVVEIYEKFEAVPEVYPQVLTRQTNVGNQAATAPPAQTTLADDGRAGGATPITIEAKQSGSSGSNLQIDNQGNLTLQQWSGTTLTQIFQVIANAAANADNVIISDSTHQTHVKGTALFDLTALFSGRIQPNVPVDTSFNGATGTATIVYPFWGTAMKMFLCVFSGYKDTVSHTFLFPSAANVGMFYIGDFTLTFNFQFQNGATIQQVFTTTGLGGAGAGTDTNQNTAHGDSLGQVPRTVDRLVINSTGTTTVTGMILFIGQ